MAYLPQYVQSHALLIGIDDYEDQPLHSAVKGARALRQVLIDDFGFLPENVVTLENEQATRDAIWQYVIDYFGNREFIGPDDQLLIFFAGHGITLAPAGEEIGYLVPFDGDPDRLSSLIEMNELRRQADKINAKHVLFLLDACFSGFATTRFLGGLPDKC